MLEFRSYHIAATPVVGVWVQLGVFGERKAGEIRPVLGEQRYWFEAMDCCIELEELEQIAAKIKELNENLSNVS